MLSEKKYEALLALPFICAQLPQTQIARLGKKVTKKCFCREQILSRFIIRNNFVEK